MNNEQKLEAKYGLFMAISMVVGQVIGSGIFFKVDDILEVTKGNVNAGLLGFLIVGISVVFAGASMANYAELSPNNGGLLNYVEYRFGNRIAAYIGWAYFSLFSPSITAVILTISGVYIAHFLTLFINFEPSFIHFTLIGLFNGLLFLWMNIFKPKSSGIFILFATVLKLLPLIFIASLGIISLTEGSSEILHSTSKNTNTEETNFWLLVAASFIPISFSMDGWYAATQISGEIKDSRKNLPRALVIGTTIVLFVYIFYYLGIVSKLSVEEISVLKDTYISELARRIGSETGTIIMQLFIIISVLGTCNGAVLANTRAPYQFYTLESTKKFWDLGKIDTKTNTPINSAIISFLLIIIYSIAFHITNIEPFFTEKSYDISAIPIIFIYIVNSLLFFGLFRPINKGQIQGNRNFKLIMLVFALLGTLLVLVGSILSPNGISYLIISLFFIAIGKFFVKS